MHFICAYVSEEHPSSQEVTIPADTKLGRYEIRSQLGAGGMGEVYRARDEKLNGDVAIKVLPAAFPKQATVEAHRLTAVNRTR